MIKVRTDESLRIDPTRVGELGGDGLLKTAQGTIMVPEGAYKVTFDGEAYVLLQCSLDDPYV